MISKTFRWLRIIGILLFVWIASQIDWLSVWTLLRGIQPGYIAGYFVVFVVALLLKVVRLRWFLSRLRYNASFGDVYQSVVEPAFYGMITPARVGEFSKVLYLSRFGMSQGQAWRVVLLERLVDFSVLLIASVVGTLYFFVWNSVQVGWGIALFFVLCLFFYYGLTQISMYFGILKICLNRLIPRLSYLEIESVALREESGLSARIFLPFSLVILILSFLQLWLLGAGLGIGSSGIYLGLAYASSSLISLLPLSVGGIGTREAVYITLLAKQGVSTNAAVTLSLLDGIVLSMLAQVILILPILKKSRHG